MINMKFAHLIGLIAVCLSSCSVKPSIIAEISSTPIPVTAISSPTPTERPPTATTEYTQTPTGFSRIPTLQPETQQDPLVLEDAVVLFRAGIDYEPWLGAALPEEKTPLKLADGCAFTFGLDSNGQVPVILGETTGKDCYSWYYYNQRLVLVTLPDLELVEITPLTPYYEVTADAYSEDAVPLEVIYVTNVAAWSKPVWSPDGRFLAFVGAINGPSSDLYVYDSYEGTIERKSSGPNQAAEPIWSPDGSGILHYEYEYEPCSFDLFTYEPRALWWAPLNGERLIRFAYNSNETAWPLFGGWLSDTRFMFWYSGPGTQDGGNLLIGDVATGSMVKIMEGVVSAITLKSEDGGTILAAVERDDGYDDLYLVDGKTGNARILPASAKMRIKNLAAQKSIQRFLVAVWKEGLLGIKPDGTIVTLDKEIEPDFLFLSPDGMHVVVADGRSYWVYEFDDEGQIAFKGQVYKGNILAWRPDSQALLLDCDDRWSTFALSPNWRSKRYTGGCPAWQGWSIHWKNLPTGVLWLDGND